MPTSIRSRIAPLARRCLLVLAVLAAAPVAAQDTALIEAFTKRPVFEAVKISPDGQHLALIAPIEDRAILVVFRRADNQQVGAFSLRGLTRVTDFWWVSNERLIVTVADQKGALDTPQPTGELFGVDFDGTGATILAGERSHEMQTGSNITKRDGAIVYADFVSLLAENKNQVLVSTTSLETVDPTTTAIEKMDVRSGVRNLQTRVKVPFATVLADHRGNARFASGERSDGYHRLFYRPGPDTEWQLVNDESTSDHREFALGLSADDKTAYLEVQLPSGPAKVVAMDLATGARTDVARDARVDPDSVVRALDAQTPVAIRFRDPAPRLQFLDAAPDLRVARSLATAFKGRDVQFAGGTGDGKFALVEVSSDREPGAAYLYDVDAKRAALLVAARPWLDPATLAEQRAFEFTARDGTPIQGVLTLPRGATGPVPLVVNPHGGPYGIADTWGFDAEAQLLAAHGYGVLKVNFRGSGNYGRAFELLGLREWGGKMQDDLTDATRAAIAQGVADPARVCLYGASYGAYAALMGPVREPGMYKCVAGYVGVYDLPMMFKKGDTKQSKSGRNYLAYVLGEDMEALRLRSPVAHAAEIKVPVFLAAAGEDERAPLAHSKAMRKALADAGNEPDWLVYDTEGHGFYALEHQREYYRRLLAFLGKHLGGKPPAAPAPAGDQ
jgi:dipeptidyl aminopeptidase/acylaminoacyl peptidase